MQVAVLTGGLGGNQDEIVEIARGLSYKTQQGLFYCGTNHDLVDRLRETLKGQNIIPKIINANEVKNLGLEEKDQAIIVVGDHLDENLVSLSYQVLNAAQIVCTKPSGDFGIEALIANKLVVALAEWGQHEGNIREILDKAGALLAPGSLLSLGEYLDKLFWTLAADPNIKYVTEKEIVRPCNFLAEKAVLLSRYLAASSPFNFNWAETTRAKLGEIRKKYTS